MNADRLTGDALQAMMRHKSYSTTQRYINIARQLDQSAKALYVPDAGAQEGCGLIGRGVFMECYRMLPSRRNEKSPARGSRNPLLELSLEMAERDSNPYGSYPHRILNPVRLPFRHSAEITLLQMPLRLYCLPLLTAAIRLMALRNALALASTLSVETPRPRYSWPWCSTCTITSPWASLPTVTLWTLKSLQTTDDAGELLDGQENGVDRAVAAGHARGAASRRRGGAASVTSRHLRRCPQIDLVRIQRPQLGARRGSAARSGPRCRRRRSPSSCRPGP